MSEEKNVALKNLVTGLEIVAGAILIGATIASLFQDLPPRKVLKKPTPKAAPDQYNEEARRLGVEILSRKLDPETQTLGDCLKQKYNGLWLIGRTGARIPDDDLNALATELRHYHAQNYKEHGHDTDRALAEWYETVGVSKQIPLSELLSRSPLVERSFNAGLYIAYAITGKRDFSLPFELYQKEWEGIKRHLMAE